MIWWRNDRISRKMREMLSKRDTVVTVLQFSQQSILQLRLRDQSVKAYKSLARNISCNKYVTDPSAGLWLFMTTTLRSWQKKLSIIFFHNSCSENHCLRHIYTVNDKPCAMKLRIRGHDFMLPFVKYNLIRRILLSEPCTIIFRMCSGLSYGFTMCFKCFSVLFFFVIY